MHRTLVNFKNLAIRTDYLERQDVMQGETVFEAMHPARVFGDVATDGTGNLRGRVGCVIKSQRLDRFRNCQVAHPGFDYRKARAFFNAQDPVHFRQAQDNTIGMRQRTT